MAYYGSTAINQGAAGLGTFFSGKVPAARAQSGLGGYYQDVSALSNQQVSQLCVALVQQGLIPASRCNRTLLLMIARILDAMITGYVDGGIARLQTLYANGDITQAGYAAFVSLGTGGGTAGLGIVPRANSRAQNILAVVLPPFAMMGLGQEEPALPPEEELPLVTAELPPEVIETTAIVAPEIAPTSVEPGEPMAVLPGEMAPPGEPVVIVPPLPPPPPPPTQWQTIGKILSYVGGVGGAYHGYKRNQSAGWAFGWFVFGTVAPIFAIPVALAQGFAKPKRT